MSRIVVLEPTLACLPDRWMDAEWETPSIVENVELDEVSTFAVVIDGLGGEVEREGGSF